MKDLYSFAMLLLDSNSSAKTYLAAVGMIGLAVYDFSTGDSVAGSKALAMGLGLFGIGHKQGATGEQVAKVVVATVPEETAVPDPRAKQ